MNFIKSRECQLPFNKQISLKVDTFALTLDGQRYHAYFMEEIDSSMIIFAGLFLSFTLFLCLCHMLITYFIHAPEWYSIKGLFDT